MICYEHPLNERIRTLLRLEDLFNKIDFFSTKESASEHHASLIALFEILEITNRADIKSDLLQELERQKLLLEMLRKNPDVSETALDSVLNDIKITFREMLDFPGKVGEHLRENEWLMAIKQRIGIHGGCCVFDLPSYHYWLNLDPVYRHEDFSEWLSPFQPIRNAFRIVLLLLRKSGRTLRVVANQGVFQHSGSEYSAHMLRLNLSDQLPCVPEISANKYALNIRFIPTQAGQKNKIYEDDVTFEITFCNL
ncbi:cell division protein ZapD [Nitrosomonas ureae]|uniref:Cell division protein ZapD n=1 Tax=Nitrosomonas ureae TaxID=44577 RepID=A0A1H5S7Y1_9PROT|nr:cell division protein ZapD [Nitrosomonas ureae]SEF46709.1 cell division protein ZapD [Nitrosomonas ureae]